MCKMYTIYLLRCTDGSLYAGIAADLARRMEEHFTGAKQCAKYTRTHPPKALCAAWESPNRATASRLEYRLKGLPKARKEFLAQGGDLKDVFEEEFAASFRPIPRNLLPRA